MYKDIYKELGSISERLKENVEEIRRGPKTWKGKYKVSPYLLHDLEYQKNEIDELRETVLMKIIDGASQASKEK